MLRREFFAKLGLGVLAMAVAPLVVLRPVRAVVSNDPDIEFEMDKWHFASFAGFSATEVESISFNCSHTSDVVKILYWAG